MELLFLCLVFIRSVLPSSHWIVTEAGKIQAQVKKHFFTNFKNEKQFFPQPDSIFFMRQPHDFVAFLHQVLLTNCHTDTVSIVVRNSECQSRTASTKTWRPFEEISTRLTISTCRTWRPSSQQRCHSSQFVSTLKYFEDPDCLLAGRPLTKFDLYVSTMVPLR